MADAELVPLKQAAQRLGITRGTMYKRVKEWRLTIYENPLDKRQKLLDWREIVEASRPKKGRPE